MISRPGAVPPTILGIVGARPNFVKIGPIAHAMARDGRMRLRLVHTGQHYDPALNDQFFADLDIPRPDVNLQVGSGSHATQTAEVMTRFEPVLDAERPAAVLVVGDVNSTLATALVAAKKGVPVIHVEAGLRSFDRAMPEEINRVLVDRLSDLLFVTEEEGVANLRREGIDGAHVSFVGNVMIDALRAQLDRATDPRTTLARFKHDAPAHYAVLTLHRPSNVDDPATLRRLLEALAKIGDTLPLIFPIHPRTRARLQSAGLAEMVAPPRFLIIEPIGYLDMLGLMAKADLVLTDSGGIQEETTALGVPCLTLRENTERPITVSEGTNTIVGTDPAKIAAAFAAFRATGGKRGRVPRLWDGQAAQRIVDAIAAWLGR